MTLPFPSDPLYPWLTHFKQQIPYDLKALYVVRYWLDWDDETRSTVGDVDVVVLTSDCENIFCRVCDLREYAFAPSMAPYVYDQPLPMAFLNEVPTIHLPEVPQQSNQDSDDLLIGRRSDKGE